MPRRIALFGLILLVIATAPPGFAGQVAGVGQAAPDFTLGFHGGGSASLSDYQGQVVLLMMIGYL